MKYKEDLENLSKKISANDDLTYKERQLLKGLLDVVIAEVPRRMSDGLYVLSHKNSGADIYSLFYCQDGKVGGVLTADRKLAGTGTDPENYRGKWIPFEEFMYEGHGTIRA